MFRKKLIAAMLLVIAVSLAFCLYPTVNGAIMDKEMKETVQSITERIEKARQEYEAGIDFSRELSNEIPKFNETLWNAMVAYNETIWEQKQRGLSDPWAYEQPSFALGDYGLEDEVFGVLTIPALDLAMPLYLGASEEHMAAGAAHLSQTSLPIGGTNTNCVIAGHCGWRGATYFRHLTDLRPGDKVYVMNLWETLTYTVTETRVIDPDEITEILIQPGRDMLTLFTCCGRGGTRRYAVYCERTG